MSFGDARPGMAAVVMIEVGGLDMLGEDRGDLGFFFRGEFAGIAALAARIDAGLNKGGGERQAPAPWFPDGRHSLP